MLERAHRKGFTLIELLIVIAIIGLLAAIAIPIYRSQTIKAKLSEVTVSMGHVASALSTYYTDEGTWPGAMNTQAALKTTLGVDIPVGGVGYINAVAVGAVGQITCTVQRTSDPNVDGNTLTLTPDTTDGGIHWTWSTGAGFPVFLKPKN